MNLPPTPNPYKRQRFPAEIIRHWVWRYWRVGLRDQEVEALRAERGISLTDEAGRSWGRQFGQAYANLWRRRRSRAGDTWPLDAVCLTINKARHDLWRAVDQGGNSRDILVQKLQILAPWTGQNGSFFFKAPITSSCLFLSMLDSSLADISQGSSYALPSIP